MNSNEWKKYKLGELSTKITKGTTPTSLGFSFIEKGINFIKVESLTFDGTIDKTKFAFISEEANQKLKRSIIEEGDILFSMAGMVLGKTAIAKKEHLPANTNQALAIIRLNQSLALPRFVEYFMRQKSFFNYVNSSTGQSAQPNINLAEIGNLIINLPSIETQKSIAKILSALDDKIELNRQTNQTLENIIQTLFKEMCFSKMVELPNRWETFKLGELITLKNGFAFKGKDFIDQGVPVIKIKNIKTGKVILNNLSYVSREIANKTQKYRVNKYDLLITMSGNRIDGTPETWVGKVGVFHKEGEYLLNQRNAVIDINNPKEISKYFLLQLLSSEELQYYFIANATSSGGQANISPELINNAEIILPPNEVLKKYDSIVSSIYEIIFANELEIETLTELRDSLLPKLMKGEIEINSL
jgi:type I restriction enzyme S subunit